MTNSNYPKEHDIKIGTLVIANENTADYIRQILPHGFESFSIFFWQTTNNLDWQKFADEINGAIEGSGAVISSLGMFGNPLEKDDIDLETLQGWKECIDNAHLFNCDIVGGFTGRLRGQSLDSSLPRFKEIWTELAKRAQDKDVRIAFENCDMEGTWATGDWNIAHNPLAWEMMFNEVPFDNVGLEWEPCHQLVSLIDPMPQLRKWVPKIFHVHGKDATIKWDVIKEYGIHSSVTSDIALEQKKMFAPPFAYHRTPGFGDSNWTDIITELRMAGFVGSIDIEGWHDPVYKDQLEMTGQVHALNYLKNCRGGSYIECPK
jgi:sugar phosphate isomerase/epimerase